MACSRKKVKCKLRFELVMNYISIVRGLIELTFKHISHCKVANANPSLELNKRVKMMCHTEDIKYKLY